MKVDVEFPECPLIGLPAQIRRVIAFRSDDEELPREQKGGREPARLLRMPLGTLSVGAAADVCIFDPEERWQVTPETLKTKSPNTPLLGMTEPT